MKKAKIWVIALLMIMLFSGAAGMMNVSASYQGANSGVRADVETIHGVFKINENTTDPLTGEKGKYGFDSSVVVASDGTLVVENATLYFLSDVAHLRSLTVYGSLILYNATLTLAVNQIQPVYHLNVTIDGSQNPSAKVEIVKSKILYEGWFKVENKNTNIVLKDSVFDKMSTTSYGPTSDFINSVVRIENCSFNNLFQRTSSGGSRYIGNMTDTTGTTATTTNGGQLTHWAANPDSQYGSYWNKVPVKELVMNVNYSTSNDYDNSSHIRLLYHGVALIDENLTRSSSATTIMLSNTSFSSADLKASDIQAGIASGDIVVEVSEVHYSGHVTVNWVEMRFLIEENVITYGIERFDFNMHHSVIYAKDLYVAADFDLDYGTTHNRIALYDDSKLYVLNLTVENSPHKEDSCIYANDSSSEVYIFRYAKIQVTFNNIPLSNLYVNATPYLIDSTLRAKVITETQNFIDNMGYGNYTGSTIWGITDSRGYAYLPLMSDIVNQSEWPNSRYVGVNNMWVNKTTNNTNYYSAQIAVDHFPNLQAENNTLNYNAILTYYKHVDVGAELWIRTPPPYLTGDPVDITVNVTNYGTELAEDVDVYLHVNAVLAGYEQIYSLNPSEKAVLSFTIPGSLINSDGEYNITVEARQVWDTNPTNNISSVMIKVGRISVSQWNVDKLINRHTANISVDLYSFYTLPSTQVTLYLDSTPLKVWPTVYAGDNVLTYLWNVNGSAGDHVLSIYVNSTVIDQTTVHVYRDVDVSVDAISISPPDIYVYEETTININITNHGLDTPSSTYLDVQVFDPYGNVATEQNISVTVVGSANYSVNFVPQINGLYSVDVAVTGGEDYDSSNNHLSLPFEVSPTPYDVTPVKEYTFVNGTTVKVDVIITSTVETSLNVNMYVQPLNLTLSPSNINNPVDIPKNGKIMAEFNIAQNVYQQLLENQNVYSVMYFVRVSSTKTMTTNTFGPFYFTLREKANFEIIPGSLVIEKDNKVLNNLNVAEGVIVQVKFMMRNTGGIPGNVTYSITDGTESLELSTVKLLGVGSSYNVTYNYTITGVGHHIISVTLNPKQNVSEKTYADNMANVSINVIPPVMEITYSVSSDEHNDKIYAGDHIVVVVRVINMNATDSQGRSVYVENAKVTVNFGALGTYHGTTNNVGVARIEFVAKRSGHYTPTISADYHGERQSVTGSSYQVMEKPLMEQIPWLWVIVGAIALAVGLFFLYGYISFKKEAKEYMICGNCGHLIPADAEKCPYCGAVFEKDKVQCPDCGSWIDEDSKYCPVCGSVFMSNEDSEYDKYMTLKDRYDQYLQKYREEARKYIGENYTQEEFFKWWKTHPEYISFLEWIKRQEEEIEGETIKCSVCGALNPKGAKICRVCGSPLPGGEEEGAKGETHELTVEAEDREPEDEMMKQYKEEYEKLQHPGVVSFEEWVKRKKAEESKQAEAKKPAKAAPAPTQKEKPVEEKVKEGYKKCPVCGALNKPDAKVCAVCGSPLKESEASKTEEKKEKSAAPSKPVVKKKVIKKVISVNEEEKK